MLVVPKVNLSQLIQPKKKTEKGPVNVLRPQKGMQEKAMRSPAQEILLGGEAGGGKSWLILFSDLADLQNIPGLRTLTLRRTSPQLGRLIEMGIEFLGPLGFKYSSQDREYGKPSFTLNNGSKMVLGHMQHEKDKHNYQGMEFQRLHFDEVTHFTESQYSYLFSRVRGKPGIPLQVINSANPDGENLLWVKRRFIDKLQAEEIAAFMRNDQGREVRVPIGTRLSMTRQWIPSIRAENASLGDDYEAMLRQLPPEMYRALALGLWETHDRHFQLIRSIWLDKAFSGDIEPKNQSNPWVIAMDYAGAGQDKCVMIVGRGNTPQFSKEWPQISTTDAAKAIYEEMERRGMFYTIVGIDTAGPGVGVYDRLMEILPERAKYNIHRLDHKSANWEEQFKSGQLKFLNFRSQGYWQLRMDFEAGNINLRPLIDTESDCIDYLTQELLMMTYNPDGIALTIIKKEELRKPEFLGRSPDYADAMMYWNWTRNQELFSADLGMFAKQDYGIDEEFFNDTSEESNFESNWV